MGDGIIEIATTNNVSGSNYKNILFVCIVINFYLCYLSTKS